MSRFPIIATLLLLSCLALAACAAASQSPAKAIVCNAAYRSAVTEPPGDVDSLRFDGDSEAQSLPYPHLELHGQYWSGEADNERALRLWVTPAGEEAVIVSQLFQLPLESGPANQFRGGHGFTGLNYAFDPASGAELQYWCEAVAG
jgi:hypothetical protein